MYLTDTINRLYDFLALSSLEMDYLGEIQRQGDTVQMLDGSLLCVSQKIDVIGYTPFIAAAVAKKEILGEKTTADVAAFAAQAVAASYVEDIGMHMVTIVYGVRFK